EEIVTANRRRDDDHRLAADRCGRRGVLDDLDQLVTMDDGTRSHGEIEPDLEGAPVRLGRHAAVLAKVAPPLGGALRDAQASRVEGPFECRRLSREEVGGCERTHQNVYDELGPLGVLPAPAAVVKVADEVAGRFAEAQVLLAKSAERRV